MKKPMLLGMLLAAPLCAAAQTCVIPDQLWERPRSGQALLALPALRACVGEHLDRPASVLTVRHALQDEAELRAAELRYWLVALALDGARVELINDLPLNEPIKIEVREK